MRDTKTGFTLIELLVVISLIGILLTVSLVAFSQTRKAARDGKRKADLEQIRSALEIYRTDEKTYYPSDDFPFGETFSSETDVYIEEVPQDPSSPTYSYRYNFVSANQYYLCAFLETGSGTLENCGGDCGTVACNYRVANP